MAKIRKTLSDTFKTYPYKKATNKALLEGGDDYVKKEEIVNDHKYSVDRKEYMKILTAIYKYRFEELLKGKKIIFPLRSGNLQLYKYRSNRKHVDFEATRKYREKHPGSNTIIYHKNYHTQGYKPLLKWENNNCAIINKRLFIFNLVRHRARDLAAYFKNNPSLINTINTI